MKGQATIQLRLRIREGDTVCDPKGRPRCVFVCNTGRVADRKEGAYGACCSLFRTLGDQVCGGNFIYSTTLVCDSSGRFLRCQACVDATEHGIDIQTTNIDFGRLCALAAMENTKRESVEAPAKPGEGE